MDSKRDSKDLKLDSGPVDLQTPIEAPPPAYTDVAVAAARTLEVHYGGWRSGIEICAQGERNQPLFRSHTRSSCSTRLEVFGRDGQLVGSSKSSSLTSKIDVDITGRGGPDVVFEMHNSASILGGSPRYTSPAFGNEQIIWRNKALSTRIIYTLLDPQGAEVAHFESDTKTKIGHLELTSKVENEEQLREIAVTLLSLLQRKMRHLEASWMMAAV